MSDSSEECPFWDFFPIGVSVSYMLVLLFTLYDEHGIYKGKMSINSLMRGLTIQKFPSHKSYQYT